MVKLLTTGLLILSLTGCYNNITGSELEPFLVGCENFGGVDHVVVHYKNAHLDYAICKDSGVQIHAGVN